MSRATRPSRLFRNLNGKIAALPMIFTAMVVFLGGTIWTVGLAITIAMVAHGAMYAPQGAMITELFPTRLRYSGASIAYQATSIVAGSLAPIIALSLYKASGGTGMVAAYVIGGLLLTLIAVIAAPETRGVDLNSVT